MLKSIKQLKVISDFRMGPKEILENLPKPIFIEAAEDHKSYLFKVEDGFYAMQIDAVGGFKLVIGESYEDLLNAAINIDKVSQGEKDAKIPEGIDQEVN